MILIESVKEDESNWCCMGCGDVPGMEIRSDLFDDTYPICLPCARIIADKLQAAIKEGE